MGSFLFEINLIDDETIRGELRDVPIAGTVVLFALAIACLMTELRRMRCRFAAEIDGLADLA